MAGPTYQDGFPKSPLEAIEYSYFLSEAEKQEWREWLNTASKDQQNELVDILHSMWQDNQKNAVPENFANTSSSTPAAPQPNNNQTAQKPVSATTTTPFGSNPSPSPALNPDPFGIGNASDAFGSDFLSPTQDSQNANTQPQSNQAFGTYPSQSQPYSSASTVTQPTNPFIQSESTNTTPTNSQTPATYPQIGRSQNNIATQTQNPFAKDPFDVNPTTAKPVVSTASTSQTTPKPVEPMVDFDPFAPTPKPSQSDSPKSNFDEFDPFAPTPKPVAKPQSKVETNKPKPKLSDALGNDTTRSKPDISPAPKKATPPPTSELNIESLVKENTYKPNPILEDSDKPKEKPATDKNDQSGESENKSKPAASSTAKLKKSTRRPKIDLEDNETDFLDNAYNEYLETQQNNRKTLASLLEKITKSIAKYDDLNDSYNDTVEKVLTMNDKLVAQAKDIQVIKDVTQIRSGDVSLQDQIDDIKLEIENLSRDFRDHKTITRNKLGEISKQMAALSADTFGAEGVEIKLQNLEQKLAKLDSRTKVDKDSRNSTPSDNYSRSEPEDEQYKEEATPFDASKFKLKKVQANDDSEEVVKTSNLDLSGVL